VGGLFGHLGHPNGVSRGIESVEGRIASGGEPSIRRIVRPLFGTADPANSIEPFDRSILDRQRFWIQPESLIGREKPGYRVGVAVDSKTKP
jgi:hypothetical protein